MIENKASRTALRVALRRAAHQVLDEPPLFVDPTAMAVAGTDRAAIAADPANQTAFGRGLRAFVAVRSRWAEERLAEAVAQGVAQYVILGAGLDTFTLRNPFPQLRVFEVDHPATQELKRARIEGAGFVVPAMTYVPVDFERETLPHALGSSGFSPESPAFFSWLGVVPYLAEAAIEETLRFVASVAAPVEVVFDYGVDPALLSLAEQLAVRELARRVAAAGEPFRTYFAPDDLHARLRGLGFTHLVDLGTDEINALYFDGRSDGLRLRGRAGRLISASR